MNRLNISTDDYIAVLEAEVETLSHDYFDPQAEGTGHFRTAILVLAHRIEYLKQHARESADLVVF